MSSQLPPQELQAVKIEPGILDSSQTVGPSSLLSSFDSTAIHKVSNSDDEDLLEQARIIRRDIDNKGGVRQLSHGPPSVEHRNLSGATRAAAGYNTAQAAYPAPRSIATSRPDGPPQYRFPYMVAELEQRKPSSPIEGSSGSALPTGVPSRHPFSISRHTARPPHHTSSMSLSYNEAMRGSQRMSQPASRGGTILPSTNLVGTQTQRDRLSPLTGGMILPSYVNDKENQGPSFNIEHEFPSELPEGAEARGYTQMLPATGKHAATPPRNDATKRFKNNSVFGPGYIDLPYKTTKVINMPARSDLTPGQEPPEPTPDNLPYGDTEDYQSCMLIYWLDEQELSYREGIELFKQRFPAETANYETVRRRHLSSLQRLAWRYGLKPASDIVKPGLKVLRRGRHAGAKYSSIGGRVLEPTTATHVAANNLSETAAAIQQASAVPSLWTQSQVNRGSTGHVRIKRVTQPLATRGFLLACIVVWKDTEGVSLEQIQQRLADDFNWKLSIKTVQKLYYKERPRVYDVGHNTGDGAHVDLEDEASTVDTIGDRPGATGEDVRVDVARHKTAHRLSL